MTDLDTRYFLGVKANKVRFKVGEEGGRGSSSPSRSRRASRDLEGGGGTGNEYAHAHTHAGGAEAEDRDRGESKTTASFFTSFEDSDLGLECVGIGSLVDVQNQGTQVTWNASWTCPSKVTTMEVHQSQSQSQHHSHQQMNMAMTMGDEEGEQGGGGYHDYYAEIWAGTCRGEVCKIRYEAGKGRMSSTAAMREDDYSDHDEENDFEVVKVHEGVVSCVDVNGQSGEVLSAGYDGSVYIHSSNNFGSSSSRGGRGGGGGGGGASRLHHSTKGAVSYTCAKWCSGDVFLTGTSASHMTLQTWDRRSKEVKTSNDLTDLLFHHTTTTTSSSSSALSSSLHSSHTILCVDVHPSRPHICCTGHEDGLIALWDLRKENKPVSFNVLRSSSSSSSSPGERGGKGEGIWGNGNFQNDLVRMQKNKPKAQRGLGHVWEVKFAPQEALQLFDRNDSIMNGSSSHAGAGGGGEHVIFACTQDGVLGCTRTGTGTGTGTGGGFGGMMEVLMTENSSIDSFDLDVENLCMMCVTGQEGLVYVRDNFSAV